MAPTANNTFWGENLQLWKKMKWLVKRRPWHKEAYTVIILIILFMVKHLADYTVPNTHRMSQNLRWSSLRHFPGAIFTGTKPNLSVCAGFIVLYPLIPDLSEYNYIRYALNQKRAAVRVAIITKQGGWGELESGMCAALWWLRLVIFLVVPRREEKKGKDETEQRGTQEA